VYFVLKIKKYPIQKKVSVVTPAPKAV